MLDCLTLSSDGVGLQRWGLASRSELRGGSVGTKARFRLLADFGSSTWRVLRCGTDELTNWPARHGLTWLDGLTFVPLRLLRSSRKMWALHRPWIASIAKVCILRAPSSLGRALSPNLCQAPRLKTCGESTKWKITGVANQMLSPDITSWGSSTASTNRAQLPHLPRTPSIVRDVGEGGAKRSFRLHSLYSFHGSGASSRSLAGRRGLQLQLSKRRAAPPSVAEDDARHNDKWRVTSHHHDDQPWYTVIYDYMILHD